HARSARRAINVSPSVERIGPVSSPALAGSVTPRTFPPAGRQRRSGGRPASCRPSKFRTPCSEDRRRHARHNRKVRQRRHKRTGGKESSSWVWLRPQRAEGDSAVGHIAVAVAVAAVLRGAAAGGKGDGGEPAGGFER